MKVKELRDLLNQHGDSIDDLDVLISVALPSIGPAATDMVTRARIGFDWDKDLILSTETPLVPKQENQSVFESAYDLLMWLATDPVRNDSYEARAARRIVMKYGKTQEDLDRLQRIFHKK